MFSNIRLLLFIEIAPIIIPVENNNEIIYLNPITEIKTSILSGHLSLKAVAIKAKITPKSISPKKIGNIKRIDGTILLNKIPLIGPPIAHLVSKIKTNIKTSRKI